MRMMMSIRVPADAGNKGMQSGELPQLLQSVLGSLQPEAAYFATTDEGDRGAYVFFDMKDPSQIPTISEPLFQGLQAQVRFQPVMTVEDLQQGLNEAKP
jgi:hypothetical protein